MKISNQKFTANRPQVIGLFKNDSSLEKTLLTLRAKGFQSEDIAILMSKNEAFKNNFFDTRERQAASTGLVTGIAAGGILGWLAGLETFIFPRVGLFIAAGPLASALAGIAIGGTIGSIAGAFISLGISKLESKKLARFIKEKGVIVSVSTSDPREQLLAKNILVINGALKIQNYPEGAIAKSKERKHFGHKLREAHSLH